MSHDTILDRAKGISAPEFWDALYRMTVFFDALSSSKTKGNDADKRRSLDFTKLPTVKPKYSLQEVMDDLRGD